MRLRLGTAPWILLLAVGACARAYGDGGVTCQQVERPPLSDDTPRTIEFFLDSAAARHATTLGVTVVSGPRDQLAVELSGSDARSRMVGPAQGHRCAVRAAGLAGEWQLRIESTAPVRLVVRDHTGRSIAGSTELQPGAPTVTISWNGAGR
jgi:hypothetical protein